MAETDPNTPQVVDPELTVDLTRLLQIRGPLGVLNVLDTIVPVVNMGDVVARTVEVRQPAFRTTDIFSNGRLAAPAAGALLADTGALSEGVYDVKVHMSVVDVTINQAVQIEMRNAANTANLAAWSYLLSDLVEGVVPHIEISLALEFATNERLRAIIVVAQVANDISVATIFARRRA